MSLSAPWRHSLYLLLLLALVVLVGQASADADAVMVAESGVWDTFRLIGTAQASNDFTLQPSVATAPNGNIIVAYNAYTNSPSFTPQQPYYSISTNGGATWSTPQSIHKSAANIRNVQVVYDNNNVAHAVWAVSNDATNTYGIFYAAQSQWAANSFLEIPSQGKEVLDPPALAVGPDNTLHVAWAQADESLVRHVYHAYRKPGGVWTVSANLDDRDPKNRFLGGGSAPDLAVDVNGKLHLVWEQIAYDDVTLEPAFEIHYLQGSPGGSGYQYNWDADATILSGTLDKARRPAVAAGPGAVHVAFALSAEDISEPQFAYYRQYSLGGGGLGPLTQVNKQGVRVNATNPYFLDPSVITCDEEIHVYFHGAQIFEATEQILGSSDASKWTALDVVTPPNQRYIFPSLLCAQGKLRIAMEKIVVEGFEHQVIFAESSNVVFLPVMFRSR